MDRKLPKFRGAVLSEEFTIGKRRSKKIIGAELKLIVDEVVSIPIDRDSSLGEFFSKKSASALNWVDPGNMPPYIPYGLTNEGKGLYKGNRTLSHPSLRESIFSRDGFKCLKCDTKWGLTLDHIIPKSMGGTNNFNNLQTLCSQCNSNKGATIVDYRK